MRRLRALRQAALARPGVCAIVSIGIAWGLFMHAIGWAQTSYYAQVRSLAAGHSDIDSLKWQAKDEAYVDGHFYSVKAPGLAALTLPPYLVLNALNAQSVARSAADNAHATAHDHWHSHAPPKYFGFDVHRTRTVQREVAQDTPMIWALTLFGAVLPGIALLLLVRWGAERVEPGFGTAAAVTLGLGTIVMTFGSEYFSHVASAALGFGAFALLMRERAGPGRIGLVAVAGLAAGLAVCFEYPLALLAAILFFYALARPDRLRRAGAFAAAAAMGAAPALLYNQWSLGSPLRFAYSYAVSVPGRSGHAELGLNSGGFFGITAPRPGAAIDLLLSGRGLLTLTPVLVMGVVGAVAMRKRGHRAEANVIAAVAALYFLYNCGLLAAPRRRHAGAAVPDPGAAVPGGGPRPRLPQVPGHHPRPRDPVRAGDARRHAHVSAPWGHGDRHLGQLAGSGKPRAHAADRARRHQRLARDPAGARRTRVRGRLRGARHARRQTRRRCAGDVRRARLEPRRDRRPNDRRRPHHPSQRRDGRARPGGRRRGVLPRHPARAALPGAASGPTPGQLRAEPGFEQGT